MKALGDLLVIVATGGPARLAGRIRNVDLRICDRVDHFARLIAKRKERTDSERLPPRFGGGHERRRQQEDEWKDSMHREMDLAMS
jgi:hypothetical protein